MPEQLLAQPAPKERPLLVIIGGRLVACALFLAIGWYQWQAVVVRRVLDDPIATIVDTVGWKPVGLQLVATGAVTATEQLPLAELKALAEQAAAPLGQTFGLGNSFLSSQLNDAERFVGYEADLQRIDGRARIHVVQTNDLVLIQVEVRPNDPTIDPVRLRRQLGDVLRRAFGSSLIELQVATKMNAVGPAVDEAEAISRLQMALAVIDGRIIATRSSGKDLEILASSPRLPGWSDVNVRLELNQVGKGTELTVQSVPPSPAALHV